MSLTNLPKRNDAAGGGSRFRAREISDKNIQYHQF